MYAALQILRADPVTAHGFSPGSMLLGRELVYPCELKKADIDFKGNFVFSYMAHQDDTISQKIFILRYHDDHALGTEIISNS